MIARLNRAYILFALFTASNLSRATPPPLAPPPLSPEIREAATRLANAMPVEETVQSINLQGDGFVSNFVAMQLAGDQPPASVRRCQPGILAAYLAPLLYRDLTEAIPVVVGRIRSNLIESFGRQMTANQLEQAITILSSSSGRALMLNSWGTQLRDSPETAGLFRYAIRDVKPSIVEAEHQCASSHGRAPIPQM